MKITADFAKITGKVKPMHGVGQPPMMGQSTHFYHYLKEAGIPYSRLHDVGGWLGGGLYVDIPNLFRNFDADENLPESYDFAFTDWLLSHIVEQGTEPFFRLGVTIENAFKTKSYNIFPPKDPEKWARICEHVVRHYNEGWANGFHFGIKYWEIWNEPDNAPDPDENPMWKGTKEQYFKLYECTSRHLKACFGDSIKVGGFASCGFYGMQSDPDCIGMEGKPTSDRNEYFIEFFREFLKYISSEEHKSPLDFFSWHTYASVPVALKHADYCRKVLNHYGFENVEDILNEWNTCPHETRRATPYAASNIMAMMLGMQKKSPSVLCFYDARVGTSIYGGLFDPSTWQPFLSYYTLVSFNQAYKKENEVETASDDPNVFVLGATKNGRSILLLSNINDHPVTAELALKGVDLSDSEVLRIDDIHKYTLTGETVENGKIVLPAYSCAEIRLG